MQKNPEDPNSIENNAKVNNFKPKNPGTYPEISQRIHNIEITDKKDTSYYEYQYKQICGLLQPVIKNLSLENPEFNPSSPLKLVTNQPIYSRDFLGKGESEVLSVIERLGSKYAMVSMSNGSFNLYNIEIRENGMLQHAGEGKGVFDGENPNRVLKVLAELLAKKGVAKHDNFEDNMKNTLSQAKLEEAYDELSNGFLESFKPFREQILAENKAQIESTSLELAKKRIIEIMESDHFSPRIEDVQNTVNSLENEIREEENKLTQVNILNIIARRRVEFKIKQLQQTLKNPKEIIDRIDKSAKIKMNWEVPIAEREFLASIPTGLGGFAEYAEYLNYIKEEENKGVEGDKPNENVIIKLRENAKLYLHPKQIKIPNQYLNSGRNEEIIITDLGQGLSAIIGAGGDIFLQLPANNKQVFQKVEVLNATSTDAKLRITEQKADGTTQNFTLEYGQKITNKDGKLSIKLTLPSGQILYQPFGENPEEKSPEN